MNSAFESAMNELLAKFDNTRDDMVRLQQTMNGLTGEARSKRRQVSVTVNAQGDVESLKFHGEGYRKLPPTELADVIVQTIREARESVRAQMWESMGDRLPPGADMADLVTGKYDWSQALGEALQVPDALFELISSPPESFAEPEGLDQMLSGLGLGQSPAAEGQPGLADLLGTAAAAPPEATADERPGQPAVTDPVEGTTEDRGGN